jgi:hypothetical protein
MEQNLEPSSRATEPTMDLYLLPRGFLLLLAAYIRIPLLCTQPFLCFHCKSLHNSRSFLQY